MGLAPWEEWVPVTKTRNFVLGDPVLDWLDLYGVTKGFVPDQHVDGHDERTDFLRFIGPKGTEFEGRVLETLRERLGHEAVRSVAEAPEDARSEEKAAETFDAMSQGIPIVVHGVLWDPENGCYGVPDLLVRSDYLNQLTETPTLPEEEAALGAPGLDSTSYHYRVVEVKFTTLTLDARGERATNSGSKKAHKAQVALYNRALGRWQDYEPPAAYLLGRRWKYRSKGQVHRGDSALDRLARVEPRGKDSESLDLADHAIAWIQRLRKEGSSWEVLPQPSIDELRPFAGHQVTQPWQHAHNLILNELRDPSLLWQVGRKGRHRALDAGFMTWDAPGLTPSVLGTGTGEWARVQQAILDAHHDRSGQLVFPSQITNNVNGWQQEPQLEFFVDFETVSDLDDDFSTFPKCGGQTLILMIGCGYSDPVKDSPWTYKCFSVDRLDEDEEARIIDEWLGFMTEVAVAKLWPGAALPTMIHWSPAERSFLSTAYNSARARHPEKGWPERLPWFDFLSEVVRAEPVVIKGSLAFGIKSFARALHSHELIETYWGDGPTDGLRAMIGAWWCHHEAQRLGCNMTDLDLMKEIQDYN